MRFVPTDFVFQQKNQNVAGNHYNLDNGFACAYKRSNNYLYLAFIKDSFFIPKKIRGILPNIYNKTIFKIDFVLR